MTDSEFNKIICERIKMLRLKNELSIEQLAYQSGISKGGLSEIERCKKEPRALTILKICCGLGMTLSEFFNFEDIKKFASKL